MKLRRKKVKPISSEADAARGFTFTAILVLAIVIGLGVWFKHKEKRNAGPPDRQVSGQPARNP